MSTMGRIQDSVHDIMRQHDMGYGETAPGLQQELGLTIEQVRVIERAVEDLVFAWHGYGEKDAERRILKPSRVTELEAENEALRRQLVGTQEWRDSYRAEIIELKDQINSGPSYWKSATEAAREQNAQLRAEIESLRAATGEGK